MYANKSGKNERIIKLYNSLSQVQLFFSVQLKPGGHSLSIRGYSDRQGFLRLKVLYQRVGNSRVELILCLQPRDRAVMLRVNTIEFVLEEFT